MTRRSAARRARRRARVAASRSSVVLGALAVGFGVGADDDGRLSDLPRGGAAPDPLADRRRSSSSGSSVSRGRSPATSSASSRTTSRCGRWARSARASTSGSSRSRRPARGLPARRAPRPDGRRRRLAPGALRPGARAAARRARRRRGCVGVDSGVPAGRRGDSRRSGSCSPGVVVPALTAALTRAAGRRQAAARAELTAELVELLRGAPELVVYGARRTRSPDPGAERRAGPPRRGATRSRPASRRASRS